MLKPIKQLFSMIVVYLILALTMQVVMALFPLDQVRESEAEGIYQPVATGTVPAANIAVTLAEGSADVELSSATIPRNYKGHLLKIYDAANVMIQGVVYTDGAGTVQNVVSTKGGTTRNWASQGAGFDDTTDCRYEIYKILALPVVATYNLTAGQFQADLTTAAAMAQPVGVDFTALGYQDGKHIFAAYDATGKAAIAYISATAPGGEGLDANLFAAFDFTSGWTSSLSATATDADTIAVPTALGGLYKEGSLATGALYKVSFAATSSAGTAISRVGLAGGEVVSGESDKYRTANNPHFYIRNDIAAMSVDVTTLVVQRLTDVATTGAFLLSTAGGSRGWWIKDAAFNPNGAVTLKILYKGD
jgi:hypothetical protein